MKRLSVIFFSLGALLIQSCSNNDLSPKNGLLTVTIDPGYYPDDYDNDVWVFISDQNGEPIAVRQVNDSTHIKFNGPPHSTLTVTFFLRVSYPNASNGSIWNSFSLNTYQGIPSGSNLHLKAATGNYQPLPDVIGHTNFTLQNYNDSDTPEYALVFSDGLSSPYDLVELDSTHYAGSSFSAPLHLRANPSKILVTTYRNDLPVYQWLNAVKPGEAVVASFDSFLPSPTIPVNKQIALGSVKTMTGANFANGYDFCEYYCRIMSKSSNFAVLPKLGYLEGFEKYFVLAVLNPFDAKTNVSYNKAGTVPSSITLPDYTYSIPNDNLYGLSVAFSNDYSYKQAFFIKYDPAWQVNWTLNASNAEAYKAPSLPGEIAKLYPMLSVEGLKVEFVSNTYCLDGYTYLEYVSDILGNTPRNVYEELRYVDMP